MDIRTTRFESWHLKLFKEGKHYARPYLDPNMRAALYRMVEGVTVLIDGEIAAIMGVAELWPGVGEVTLVPSDLFYKYTKTCLKLTRGFLDLAFPTLHMHRLQATTMALNERHGRFMQALGFEGPYPLPKYGTGGEDFQMWHKVI